MIRWFMTHVVDVPTASVLCISTILLAAFSSLVFTMQDTAPASFDLASSTTIICKNKRWDP